MIKLLLPLVEVAALVVGAAPATSQSTATHTVQIKRSAFQPAAVTIELNKPIVNYGESIVLSGTVSTGNANETVTLWSQPYGQASFSQITQVLTTTGGAWSYVLPTA